MFDLSLPVLVRPTISIEIHPFGSRPPSSRILKGFGLGSRLSELSITLFGSGRAACSDMRPRRRGRNSTAWGLHPSLQPG